MNLASEHKERGKLPYVEPLLWSLIKSAGLLAALLRRSFFSRSTVAFPMHPTRGAMYYNWNE